MASLDNSTNKFQKFLRPLDFIFFMRPVILVPLWSFILIGYYHSHNLVHIDSLFHFNLSYQLIIKSILSTLIMGSIYIINQIYDRETDALNRKLFFIPTRIITLKQAKLQIIILLIVFFIGIFLFKLDFYFTLFNILLLILGLCYSIPPLQFKSRPGLDLLVNTVGYGWLAFFIGWTADTPVSQEMFILSLPYFIFMAAVYINTTLVDIEGDLRSGLSTTGVYLGKNKASLISLFIVLLTLILSFIQSNWIIFSIVGISSPLFVVAKFWKDRKYFLLSVQVPGWLFVIFLGLIYPYYFLFIIFIYLLTKFYYKHRFNMNYPRLGEEKQAT